MTRAAMLSQAADRKRRAAIAAGRAPRATARQRRLALGALYHPGRDAYDRLGRAEHATRWRADTGALFTRRAAPTTGEVRALADTLAALELAADLLAEG